MVLGGVALRLIDAVVPHLHLENDISKAEGIQPRKKKLSKTALLFLAITIHNFPEELAVGVTFGALAGGNMTLAGLMGAIGLAIRIGLQNVPEGAALSIPIRADAKSRIKAFYVGSMSAIVEPIGAIMGAALVMWMMAIIPYALAFAAGAMIFVVTEELIPESQTNGNTDVATLGLMVVPVCIGLSSFQIDGVRDENCNCWSRYCRFNGCLLLIKRKRRRGYCF